MNNLSTYLRNALANVALRNQPYTAPTNVYLALYTADPTPDDTATEVSGNAYARQQITFGAPTAGVCTSTADVTFPQATGSWGTVAYGGIRDALTGGNLLWSGALGSSQAIATGGVLQFFAYSLFA